MESVEIPICTHRHGTWMKGGFRLFQSYPVITVSCLLAYWCVLCRVLITRSHGSVWECRKDDSNISRDVVLGLGPWSLVVLKDKIAVLGPVLGLACWVLGPGLGLEGKSLVLALNFKSLVESFCHNKLVVQWYGPWFTWFGNTGSSLRPTTASIQPLLSYVLCSPATSAVCTYGTCVPSQWTAAHASKSSTHVQLSVGNFGLPEMQQFCLCVMLFNATYDRFMLQNWTVNTWRTLMNYSTDKIFIQNLLLYTERVFWFQLFVIDLIFWHVTFTTDLCGASKI